MQDYEKMEVPLRPSPNMVISSPNMVESPTNMVVSPPNVVVSPPEVINTPAKDDVTTKVPNGELLNGNCSYGEDIAVMDEEEYVVEKIINHRFTEDGRKEYFLKWKGYPDEDNTWEPSNNLNCKSLINAYENKKKTLQGRKENTVVGKENVGNTKQVKRKLAAAGAGGGGRKKVASSNAAKKRKSQIEDGLVAEQILAATEVSGEVYLLIKWKGSDNANLVPARDANISFPQMVIAFYESRLTFTPKVPKVYEKLEEAIAKQNGNCSDNVSVTDSTDNAMLTGNASTDSTVMADSASTDSMVMTDNGSTDSTVMADDVSTDSTMVIDNASTDSTKATDNSSTDPSVITDNSSNNPSIISDNLSTDPKTNLSKDSEMPESGDTSSKQNGTCNGAFHNKDENTDESCLKINGNCDDRQSNNS